MDPIRCGHCAEEIFEFMRVCPNCGHQTDLDTRAPAADLPLEARLSTDATDSPDPAVEDRPAPASPLVPTDRSALGARELMMAAIALTVGAAITLALLMTRDVPATLPQAGTASADAPAAAIRAAGLPAPPAAVPPASPAWNTESRTRWLGRGQKGVVFDVIADSPVAVWMRAVRPALVIRCVDRRTEAFVFTDSPVMMEPKTDDHTVTFIIDDGDAITELWPDSLEHDALFAPDGEAFARRLLGARTLGFGFTPHNAAPVVARFHVEGLDHLLAPVSGTCGWTMEARAGLR